MKKRYFILFVILLFKSTIFSQQSTISDCLPLDSFQVKCEKGLLDLKKYIDGTPILDYEHQNIMYCSNQLHWDIVGEQIISRLNYKESDYIDYEELLNMPNDSFTINTRIDDSTYVEEEPQLEEQELQLTEYAQNKYGIFHIIYREYKKLYRKYTHQLKNEYGESYGLGGALYIERLKTYPTTANGKTYFVLCD